MKLAVVIAGENALPSAFVVWRGFESSIKKAAEAGYHGVELALKSVSEINRSQLSQWLSRSNMEISCISTGQVFADSALYFTHPDLEKRKQVISVFKDFIGLAKDYGKIVNIGRIRGFVSESQTRQEAEDLFINTISDIAEDAYKHGVTLIIEPVNRYEINFVNNCDEGEELISKLNCPNVGLMPDLFHMNIEDDVIEDSLERNSRHIKYIHFADSNRLAPGQGHIDFDSVFDTLKKVNYDGWVSVEILPEPSPDEAALQAAEFLIPKINKYNMKG